MGNRLASAEELWKSEAPTVRSSNDLEEYARQAEALLHENQSTLPPGATSSIELKPRFTSYEDIARSELAGTVPLDRIPFIAVSEDDLAWFDLAPSPALIVSRVDGQATLRTIIADLPLLSALGDVCDLVDQGIIAFHGFGQRSSTS